jgi:hypothetical protein
MFQGVNVLFTSKATGHIGTEYRTSGQVLRMHSQVPVTDQLDFFPVLFGPRANA